MGRQLPNAAGPGRPEAANLAYPTQISSGDGIAIDVGLSLLKTKFLIEFVRCEPRWSRGQVNTDCPRLGRASDGRLTKSGSDTETASIGRNDYILDPCAHSCRKPEEHERQRSDDDLKVGSRDEKNGCGRIDYLAKVFATKRRRGRRQIRKQAVHGFNEVGSNVGN